MENTRGNNRPQGERQTGENNRVAPRAQTWGESRKAEQAEAQKRTRDKAPARRKNTKTRTEKSASPQRQRNATKARSTHSADTPQVALRPNGLAALGLNLNSETARQAVILSEIIGQPVSKRKQRM
ncbi:MAG: hypothetical protein FWC13_09080 [Oscillospiraceae bacterium]|nr:hypothetical protein [Oscillospiraceae bacterium]